MQSLTEICSPPEQKRSRWIPTPQYPVRAAFAKTLVSMRFPICCRESAESASPRWQIPAHALLLDISFPQAGWITGRSSEWRSTRDGDGVIFWANNSEERQMLYWAVVCLIVAIVAGVLGFGGIAGTATDMARILFVVFLILFVVSLVMRRPV